MKTAAKHFGLVVGP